MHVRMGVDTTIWTSYVLYYQKNAVSDWQFEKTGCPDGSLKMPRAFFQLIKIQLLQTLQLEAIWWNEGRKKFTFSREYQWIF